MELKMHKNFRGFYTPRDEDLSSLWMSDKTIFIFDTNTLFNLYRCEKQTREDLLNVMRKISKQSWFPFQVYYEYQRNRKEVISDSIKSLEAIKTTLRSVSNQTEKALSEGKVKKHLYSSLSNELNELQKELIIPIDKFITTNIEPRIEEKKLIGKSDFIRKSIDKIIGDNCGDVPSQNIIDMINKEGEERYKSKIPPGFSDAPNKKGDSFFSSIKFSDKFGDLYLWMEIIEKAKKSKGHNIFFISDDVKKDWWFIHNGERVGPLESLQTEIYNASEIDTFRMLTQSSFLYEAKKFLKGIKVSDSSVEEAKTFSIIDKDFSFEGLRTNIKSNSYSHLWGDNTNLTRGALSESSDDTINMKFSSILNEYTNIRDEYSILFKSFQKAQELAEEYYQNNKIHSPLKDALSLLMAKAISYIEEIEPIITELKSRLTLNDWTDFNHIFQECHSYIHINMVELRNTLSKIESLLL
jgi:hypothetical protein